MVQLVKHDLEFILKQIKIAEAHSEAVEKITGEKTADQIGDALRELVDNPLLPYGLRTVDGAYNNLIPGHEWSGSADQIMPRLLNPKYVPADPLPAGAHGPGSPAGTTPTHYGNTGDVWDADPRIISNLIGDQSLDNPAAIYAALSYAGVATADLAAAVSAIQATKVALDTAIANAGPTPAEIVVLEQALQEAQADATTAAAN